MLLAGCGMVDGRGDGRLPAPMAVRDYPVKIGRPYQIGGVTYTPADAPDYDEVGYASWYGGAHKGKPTANGEHFRPEGISAAHKTLRSEEHTSELQSLMRNSYAVFCLKKKNTLSSPVHNSYDK